MNMELGFSLIFNFATYLGKIRIFLQIFEVAVKKIHIYYKQGCPDVGHLSDADAHVLNV